MCGECLRDSTPSVPELQADHQEIAAVYHAKHGSSEPAAGRHLRNLYSWRIAASALLVHARRTHAVYSGEEGKLGLSAKRLHRSDPVRPVGRHQDRAELSAFTLLERPSKSESAAEAVRLAAFRRRERTDGLVPLQARSPHLRWRSFASVQRRTHRGARPGPTPRRRSHRGCLNYSPKIGQCRKLRPDVC